MHSNRKTKDSHLKCAFKTVKFTEIVNIIERIFLKLFAHEILVIHWCYCWQETPVNSN